MAKADFSYEVRKLPTDPTWIEEYVVRTSDGDSVGTVAAVLERAGGERLLVIEAGATVPTESPSLGRDRPDRPRRGRSVAESRRGLVRAAGAGARPGQGGRGRGRRPGGAPSQRG